MADVKASDGMHLGTEESPTSSSHTSWCNRLVVWRQQNGWVMPVNNRDLDAEQMSLASWVSKVRRRYKKSLGQKPSLQQLTPDEQAEFNLAVGPADMARKLIRDDGPTGSSSSA